MDDLLMGVLNYQAVLASVSLRAHVKFDEFQKLRFEIPYRLVAHQTLGKPGCLGLFLVFFSGLISFGAFQQGLTLIGIGMIIFGLAVLVSFVAFKKAASDIIECQFEGLALEVPDQELKLFPWCDVLSGRFITNVVTTHGRSPSSFTVLHIYLAGHGDVVINPTHQPSMEAILNLICPSLEKVAEARRLMTVSGLNASAAAASVGLSLPT